MLKPEDFDKKILEADSESIQKMLRNVDLDSLSIALINAPKEVLDRILDEQKCYKRARALLIEDMEYRKKEKRKKMTASFLFSISLCMASYPVRHLRSWRSGSQFRLCRNMVIRFHGTSSDSFWSASRILSAFLADRCGRFHGSCRSGDRRCSEYFLCSAG